MGALYILRRSNSKSWTACPGRVRPGKLMSGQKVQLPIKIPALAQIGSRGNKRNEGDWSCN